MRLAVVIPLANEEATVSELLARVTAQLGPDDAIFCIVDDASWDNTRGAVESWSGERGAGRTGINTQIPKNPNTQRSTNNEELRTKNSPVSGRAIQPSTINHQPSFAGTVPVHCIYAPENSCVVDAYFRGYHEAYDAGAQWILEMDGGLSHLPEAIPQFIAAMESGIDFAGGSRFCEGGSFQGRFTRRLVSRVGTFAANFLLKTQMTDMTSGFECFSRRAMKTVLDQGVLSKAHFFQTEIRYLMHRLNWVEIPITYSCPSKSVGKNSLFDAVKCLYALWKKELPQRR